MGGEKGKNNEEENDETHEQLTTTGKTHDRPPGYVANNYPCPVGRGKGKVSSFAE
jgi:hypothetical protein